MKRQHKTPCAQCPFRRDSLRGYLGGMPAEEFKALAQSETRMPCHAHAGTDGVDYGDTEGNLKLPQCAGRAIHWTNQIKTQRPGSNLLELPADREKIFEWPSEMLTYHKSLQR